MKRIAVFAAFALALPAGAEVVPPAGPPIGPEIFVLGEVHDNPAHHAEQARLVALIRPSAVIWEMLSPEQLAAADGVDRADAAAFGAALGWEAAGWPDFAMYHPIFLAAGDAAHLGAAVPRADLNRAVAEGAAAVLADPSIPIPPLSPEDQAAREAEQAAAHCNALPADLLPGMVAAQRLRDAVMAQAALAALDRLGPPVVVITGSGHARTDTGIPALIAAARPGLPVWSLGQGESVPEADPPFDAVNITPPVARDDPCAQFATGTDG